MTVASTSRQSHHTVMLGGVRWHYVDVGTGPVILLVHGWPQDHREWLPLIDLLGADYRLIAPDMPGSGYSSMLPGEKNADALADGLAGLLDHLGVRECSVVGHDWGSVWAQALAARAPGRVSKLVAIDMMVPGTGHHEAGMVPREGGQWFWHMAFQSVPTVPEALIEGAEHAYYSENFLAYCGTPQNLTHRLIEDYTRQASSIGRAAAGLGIYREFFADAEQTQRQLSNGRMPLKVLAIGGEHCVGAATADSFAVIADDVTSMVVAHAGHWLPEEQSELIADLVRRFLAGLPVTPPRRGLDNPASSVSSGRTNNRKDHP